MFEYIWLLLLPLAAASGWYAATHRRRRHDSCPPVLNDQYVEGLNFLLNEQPDKALEVFIGLVEVDRDTVETHLILGSLFRRRGEVERAIRVHQNLIARPSLEHKQRVSALLELGKDYLSAGLLDRAESIFADLVDHPPLRVEVHRHLLRLYEQEREWSRAIETATALQQASGELQGGLIAHYYCELADLAIKRGDLNEARKMAQQGLKSDHESVRALTLLGDLASRHGNGDEAIAHYRRALTENPGYASFVFQRLHDTGERQRDLSEWTAWLRDAYREHGTESLLLALVESLVEQREYREALALLDTVIARGDASIAILGHYLELVKIIGGAEAALSAIDQVGKALSSMRDGRAYQCERCGFESTSMQWQCPACDAWGTTSPALPLATHPLDEAKQTKADSSEQT